MLLLVIVIISSFRYSCSVTKANEFQLSLQRMHFSYYQLLLLVININFASRLAYLNFLEAHVTQLVSLPQLHTGIHKG